VIIDKRKSWVQKWAIFVEMKNCLEESHKLEIWQKSSKIESAVKNSQNDEKLTSWIDGSRFKKFVLQGYMMRW
jgi:hypothetical protein